MSNHNDPDSDRAFKLAVSSVLDNFNQMFFVRNFNRVSSRSHRKQFLFVKLIQVPLQLLSLLERYLFTWFLFFFVQPYAERGILG